ncbi:MAG: hypothetical protein WC785_10020 [Tatlockia sp.]
MNINFSKSSLTAILLSLASASFSNQVTFINGSSTPMNINVAYKTIVEDDGKILIQDNLLNVPGGTAVNLTPGNHSSIGIVPVSVNGHLIPMNGNFRAEDTCAIMFDDNKSTATLTLTYVAKTKNNKAFISCSKEIN